jgi:two-component system, NtrC family, nitrogen regulation sensor histidine kinase NtrY
MRRFRVQITTRVLLLAAIVALAAYFFSSGSVFVAAAVSGLALFQLIGLIRYCERTTRDVAAFLEAVRYDDFQQRFTIGRLGGDFETLGNELNRVMNAFRDARAEKEESLRYLQTVVQHVGTGLLAIRHDGTIELANTSAKRLLAVPRLKHMADLRNANNELCAAVETLAPGERTLIRIPLGGDFQHLSLHATEFRLKGNHYRLIALQNIQSELEEQEARAWQELTRVLTHEIMNSITPISSLASTAREILTEIPTRDGEEESLGDVRSAVQTIERRSQGLLNFVQAYRTLMRVPRPVFQEIGAAALFADLEELLGPDLMARGVKLTCTVEPADLVVIADPGQVEQALINLIRNGADAAAGRSDAHIRVHAFQDASGHVVIEVQDNGPGIVPEALDQIFIPFFTTKKEGSGIGLSLTRQIMRQHRGTVRVTSPPGEPTIFSLRF